MVGVNQDVVINKLIERGVIRRSERRGRYFLADEGPIVTRNRNYILQRFAINPDDPMTGEILVDRWLLNEAEIRRALGMAQEMPLRTIQRLSYHSGERNYDEYISRVQPDDDGVRRTFGLEYEVYTLNQQQESKLAYLLDTLPAHVTERDGSLGSNGVEIVFMPMSASDYVTTVKKLEQFIREENIQMSYNNEDDGAGMHTTYGVSNAEATKEDLQIRLNRYALALAALSTKPRIKQIFGRTFGRYRELPRYTMQMDHSNAFSCNGRPRTCWECRLPNWKANPEDLVKFFRITETAFHRPFNASDFDKLYDLLGVVTE